MKAIDSLDDVLNKNYKTEELKNAKIAKTLAGYSFEATKATVVQKELNNAQIDAILRAQGYQGELLKTTTDQLANAASIHKVSSAQINASGTTSTLGMAFSGLGAKIKMTTAAMWQFLTTTPVGWALMAGAAIFGVVKLYDALTVSVEEQKEKLKEVKEEYDSVTNELSNLNSELDSANEKIKELESLDKLTWVDQQELDNLREVTHQLELQQALKKDAQLEAAEKLYAENQKTFNTEFKGAVGLNVKQLTADLSDGGIGVNQLDLENNIVNMIAALHYLEKEKKKLTDENEVKEYDEYIKNITDSVKKNGREFLESLSGYKKNIIDISSVRELTADEKDFNRYLSSMQKMIYEYYDPATWNSLGFDSIFKTEGIEKTKEELIQMAKSGKLSPETIKRYTNLNEALRKADLILGKGENSAEAFCKELKAQADAIGEVNEEISKTNVPSRFNFENLEGLESKLSSIQSAYDTATNAAKEFSEQGYLNMDTVDSLISLSDAYVNALFNESGQLNVTAETFKELARIKIEESKASVYQEACSELTRIKTLETSLAAQELALSNGTLTQSAYETAKALYEEVVAMGGVNATLATNVWGAAKKRVAILDSQLKNVTSSTYDFAKASKSATKEVETDWKALLDKEITALEKQFDAGYSDFSTYIDKRKKLIEDYYKNGLIKAADYYSELEAMYRSQQDFYDSALSAVTRRLDVEIDKWQSLIDTVEKENDALEAQKDKYDGVISAVQKLIQTKKDETQDTIDALEKQNDEIQEEIDGYDSVLRAVDRVYDAEMKALQDQQQAIDDRINALREANDEEQRGIELEKAKAELARSMTQRTKYTFNGEQFVYTTDQGAINDAKDKIKDLELEQTISDMEKEKEALQGTIDKLDEYRQKWNEIADAYQNAIDKNIAQNILGQDYDQTVLLNRIEDIEAFKDRYMSAQTQMDDNTSLILSYQEKLLYYDSLSEKWSNLATLREETVNRELAAQILGADWETQILGGRLVTFDDFKNQYLAIQDQIEDNTGLIASYEEKIVYYQGLKDQWNSVTDVYKNNMDDQKAAMLFGADWEEKIVSGRLDVLNNFRNEYNAIQQAIADAAWKSANEQINAAKEAQKAAAGSTGNAGSIGTNGTTNKTDIFNSNTGSWNDSNALKQEQLSKRESENRSKIELISGKKKIAKYKNGGLITDENSSGDLDFIARANGEDHTVLVRNNERIIPEQQFLGMKMLSNALPDLFSPQTFMPNFKVPTFDYEMVMKNNNDSINLSIGDIHVHDVKNPDALAETIVRELPNKMLQALNRRRM